jgi:hypothetical protein
VIISASRIPRIGLPLLGQMNAEASGSRIRKMGLPAASAGLTVFDHPGGGYPSPEV